MHCLIVDVLVWYDSMIGPIRKLRSRRIEIIENSVFVRTSFNIQSSWKIEFFL